MPSILFLHCRSGGGRGPKNALIVPQERERERKEDERSAKRNGCNEGRPRNSPGLSIHRRQGGASRTEGEMVVEGNATALRIAFQWGRTLLAFSFSLLFLRRRQRTNVGCQVCYWYILLYIVWRTFFALVSDSTPFTRPLPERERLHLSVSSPCPRSPKAKGGREGGREGGIETDGEDKLVRATEPSPPTREGGREDGFVRPGLVEGWGSLLLPSLSALPSSTPLTLRKSRFSCFNSFSDAPFLLPSLSNWCSGFWKGERWRLRRRRRRRCRNVGGGGGGRRVF